MSEAAESQAKREVDVITGFRGTEATLDTLPEQCQWSHGDGYLPGLSKDCVTRGEDQSPEATLLEAGLPKRSKGWHDI